MHLFYGNIQEAKTNTALTEAYLFNKILLNILKPICQGTRDHVGLSALKYALTLSLVKELSIISNLKSSKMHIGQKGDNFTIRPLKV